MGARASFCHHSHSVVDSKSADGRREHEMSFPTAVSFNNLFDVYELCNALFMALFLCVRFIRMSHVK